ncbi:hypothetical protein [Jatrophihabitans sp.]|uniref:hypothetical protein n=1 Tax=Jatrophihabitans sp. TaxID=1932789 RepID=UPI0030C6E578|nr:hypothetical protein [Jatrophihabitans sp.]
MIRRIVIVGCSAAAIVGVGTAALATTGDSSSATSTTATPASSTSSAAATPKSGAALKRFAKLHPGIAAAITHRGVHGEIVTSNGKGGFVTHDGILGTVSAVSSSSITVKSADGFSQTYTVGTGTKVRIRKSAAKATISDVHSGDKVGVVGTGTSTPTATFIVEAAS